MADSNLSNHEDALDPHTQYLREAVVTQKGDIVVGLANALPGVHPVSVNGYVLMCTENSVTGLLWVPIAELVQPLIDAAIAAISGECDRLDFSVECNSQYLPVVM